MARLSSRSRGAAQSDGLAHRLVCLVAFALSAMPILTSAAIVQAQSSRVVLPASEDPKFEAASIKRSNGGPLNNPDVSPGRLTFANVTLHHLIEMAYAVHDYQIAGEPNWANRDGFAIVAKAADGASPGRMLLMVRSLIEDRFQLKVHREIVQAPVYILTQAKGGHKMRETAPGSCLDANAKRAPRTADDAPPIPQCDIRGNMARGKLTGVGVPISLPDMTAVPVAPFGSFLSMMLDRPVIDRTGLSGRYDFTLEFAPGVSMNESPGPTAIDTPEGPSMFTALSEQLGLKLEAGRGPVEHLVIDHVTYPSEN